MKTLGEQAAEKIFDLLDCNHLPDSDPRRKEAAQIIDTLDQQRTPCCEKLREALERASVIHALLLKNKYRVESLEWQSDLTDSLKQCREALSQQPASVGSEEWKVEHSEIGFAVIGGDGVQIVTGEWLSDAEAIRDAHNVALRRQSASTDEKVKELRKADSLVISELTEAWRDSLVKALEETADSCGQSVSLAKGLRRLAENIHRKRRVAAPKA